MSWLRLTAGRCPRGEGLSNKQEGRSYTLIFEYDDFWLLEKQMGLGQ